MHAERADECRPNLFVNTPDILHESLQTGGPAMFAIRATLAATMSPTWGVYSGFELFEAGRAAGQRGVHGLREVRSCARATSPPPLNEGRSLEPYLTRLNEIRRAHPALQQLRDIHFHHTDNDQVIAYSKTDVTHRRHRAGGRARWTRTTPDGQPRPGHAGAGRGLGATPSSCTTRSAAATFHWGQFTALRRGSTPV